MSISEKMTIEEATEDDLYWLTEASKRAYDDDQDYVDHEAAPEGYDTVKNHAKLKEYNDYYRITLDDYTIGGVIVSYQGEQQREILRIFVDPDYQRQGIGIKAIQLIMNLYPNVKLWTGGAPEWSRRANNFLTNLGFKQIGTITDSKGQINNWYHKQLDDINRLTPISELKDGMKNVNVKGKIKEKAIARMVRSRRRGETLSVTEAGLEDKTGRVILTLWNEQIRQVSIGDEIQVDNSYVSSYKGIKQLNIGRSGKLIKTL